LAVSRQSQSNFDFEINSKILVVHLEEIEARNKNVGEGRQQFDRPNPALV
jgi:hypothetical protein